MYKRQAVAEAGRIAGSFAGRLVTVLGGTVWPPEAASTDVVPLTTDVSAVPVPATATPAVDVLTASTAVVIQDRPRVAMTSWLSDALRTAAEDDRAVQIVTPPGARLTLATRTALRGLPNRWVVRDPEDGYYDGLSGAVLHWKGGTFTPVRDAHGAARLARAFTAVTATGERQLLLTLRTRYPADPDLVLGRSLEAACTRLTGRPPAGWSTAEPVNLPWSTRQVTDLARSRAPRPTWLIAVGRPDRPLLAGVRVLRTPAGVEEDITLTLGHGAGEPPPLDAVEGLAAELDAEHGLVTLLTALRPGRRDLTVPAHAEQPPTPVTFTVGRAEAARIGPSPASLPAPVRLGPGREAALHYRLGKTGPAWEQLRELAGMLQGAAGREGSFGV